MSKLLQATTADGFCIEYIDEIIGSGSMKNVYYATDGKNVVAFFRDKLDLAGEERLEMITGLYRERIFKQQGGDYWENILCWPTHIVKNETGEIGLIVPLYQSHFFFEKGSINDDFLNIKGKEKEGKWFSSASNRNRYLDPFERGDWLSYLRISLWISRAVRRLHAAGLAHSDLSYKNVLIDPVEGNACIIDIDGLVVPGKFPPDVVGTPDFIAPEVVQTTHLKKTDPKRKLPCIDTDKHALAVLIYMYLFLRHPLDGDKVHDIRDDQRDQALRMGERALFIEHPTDQSNRINLNYVHSAELLWKNTASLPYHIAGPYLAKLFKKAFVDGLHTPNQRPTAGEWEQALIKTLDLIQPCINAKCEQKWYVFDNSKSPCCPFCHTAYKGKLPVLNFYSSRRDGKYLPDNHRLMVYSEQSIFEWHINKKIIPNEHLDPKHQQRVGYFIFHNNNWLLINEKIPDLMEIQTKKIIPIGDCTILNDGTQLLFSKKEGGRLAVVQLVIK